MKHFSRLLIVCILTVFFCGCGKKEKIESYKYASYDEFATSTSAEYSYAGWDIYIEGTLTGFEMMMFDDIEYLTATVEESKGKEWIVRIGQAGTCSDAELTDSIGTKIRCFGEFLKNEGDNPVLVLNLEDEYCIQKCRNNETLFTAEDLKPSSRFVMKWYDANADEAIVGDVYDVLAKVKKPGAYISSGIIDSLDDGDDTFTLYQKDGDKFVYSFIHLEEDPLSVSSLQDIKKEMKDGDAIKLYFIVDEKGFMHIIDYSTTTLSYTYNKEDSTAQVLFEKKYDWGDSGYISYTVLYQKAENRYSYRINALADDYDSVNAAAMWYITTLFNKRIFAIQINIVDSNEGVLLMSLKEGEADSMWYDKSRNASFDAPSWFNITETTDSITKAMIEVIEIDNQFEEDYGYDFK